MKEFYTEIIDGLLENYEAGEAKNKPDVLKQMKEIEDERRKINEGQKQKQGEEGKIILNQNGQNIELNNQQIVQIMQKQQEQLQTLTKTLEAKDEEIATLKLRPVCTLDIKDKDEEQLNMSFLNVDLKLDILTRLCESIHSEQTKK